MDQKIEVFLTKLKIYGEKKNIPNIPPLFGNFLNTLIQLHQWKNILEVGCANGYSTIWIAEALQKFKGKMISIDKSTPSLNQAKRNLREIELENIVEFIEGEALDIIPTIKQKFDFIFIDAQKSYYADFFSLVQKKLTTNGYLLFDNVKKFPQKTEKFWTVINNQNAFQYLEIPTGEGDSALLLWKAN